MLPPSVHLSPFFLSIIPHFPQEPFQPSHSKYKLIVSFVIWTEKMCASFERCGQCRPPEQCTFRLQEGIPWDCTFHPLQQQWSNSTPAQQGASHVEELGIALSISGAALRHSVSKYTVLQRTSLCFFPGAKLAVSCSGFILGNHNLTHRNML